MENKSFEEKYKELNLLVDKLQEEDISIDSSIENFKKAIVLHKECKEILDNANEEIVKLMGDNNEE
ncbi:MAG: exodeoxyribonuclease VII small subunit [Mycoplasmatales bacterium]